MIDNIQYQHECSNSVAKKRAVECEDHMVIGLAPANDMALDCEALLEHTQAQLALEYSLRDIKQAIVSEFSHDNTVFGHRLYEFFQSIKFLQLIVRAGSTSFFPKDVKRRVLVKYLTIHRDVQCHLCIQLVVVREFRRDGMFDVP